MNLKEQINPEKLPRHIAIIMDGNGRWAKERGMPRVFGHRNGVEAVRDTTEACAQLGIQYLTLYAFSTENWNRPALEVNALMGLLVETIKRELKTLHDNSIRLSAIGDLDRLPERSRKTLRDAIDATSGNTRMSLVLALNYSARWELVETTRQLARQVRDGLLNPEDIDDAMFSTALSTSGIPDPELLIRTSGETRISNFLLWQIAYTEFFFTPVRWPDFRREHLYEAIVDFQHRERRFGQTSEQVAK
ncbi:MAG: hypothetical protein RLY31_861 [Bacteroidota bacterium]|jgi:undecaprenyl diphosphate synthase